MMSHQDNSLLDITYRQGYLNSICYLFLSRYTFRSYDHPQEGMFMQWESADPCSGEGINSKNC
jgi:hypothetical protein